MKDKKNNSGAAMIVVVCIMSVVIVLCLALLLASSMISVNSHKKLMRQQCRIAAVSLSKQLQEEIEITVSGTNAIVPEPDGLWCYIRDRVNTSSWTYYNADEAGHSSVRAFRTFKIDTSTVTGADGSAKAILDDLEVTMYWTSETGAEPGSSMFYTVVTAKKDESSSTITTSYELTITQDTENTGGDIWKWTMSSRE